MIEEESVSAQNNNSNDEDAFEQLIHSLQTAYPMFNPSLVNKRDFFYQMKLNNIKPDDILDEMAAFFFNYSNSNSNTKLNSDLLNTWLTKSLSSRVQIALSEQKNKIKVFPAKKAIKPAQLPQVDLKVKSTLAFPENANYLLIPSDFNSSLAKVQFYSNYDVKEYPLIPKDEWESEERYIKYFAKMKSVLFQKLQRKEEDPLLNISKFVLIVCFETTDSKPILKDVRLVDPLNGFVKYKIKYDKDYPFKSYLVSGQILYVEGDVINDEIIIKAFSPGFDVESYSISEEGLKPFFSESAAYLFYSLNGPFYSNEDIDLSLYTQTLRRLAETNPHCVLLNGPFIHAENELIKAGDIQMSYFTLFEKMIEIINRLFKDKRTTVLICPSLGDVLNYYPLPQPPFNLTEIPSISKLEIFKAQRLKFVSNPYTFQLNEMIIGLANFDFVKDITSNCLRISNKAPIDIGLETVIEQKSFYPLLQNTFSTIDELKMDKMTTVDIGHYEHLTFDVSPDVIITSSSMNPFAKKIYSTVFINSGGLYKGKTPGSYSRIISYPFNSFTGTDVFNRLQVDFFKVELAKEQA